MDLVDIAPIFLDKMKQLGYTYDTLAERSGVPKTTLHGILHGTRHDSSWQSIIQIAIALNVSIDSVYGIEPDTNNEQLTSAQISAILETEIHTPREFYMQEADKLHQETERLHQENEQLIQRFSDEIQRRDALIDRQSRALRIHRFVNAVSIAFIILWWMVDYLVPARGWILREIAQQFSGLMPFIKG